MTLSLPEHPNANEDRIAQQFPIQWLNIAGEFGPWHAPPLLSAPGSVATGATNLLYYAQVSIFGTTSAITGVAYNVGAVQNGNVRSGIYNAAGTGQASRTTNLAQAAPNTVQQVAFDTPLRLTAGYYFIALVFSSATATVLAANTAAPSGGVNNGSMTMPGTITPPTTFGFVPTMSTF